LAGGSAGASPPSAGIVVAVLLLILILVLILVLVVRGLEERAAGLGESDGVLVAGLRRQRLGPAVSVAGALVVGRRGWELGGVVRGGVVVLDDGGG
jgi:hypothetical protein